jgi:hypothetical protein
MFSALPSSYGFYPKGRILSILSAPSENVPGEFVL